MAQGVALIPPLNYKYPLTPSHSTHTRALLSPFPRCKSSIGQLGLRERCSSSRVVLGGLIYFYHTFVRLKYLIYIYLL
jgi:hypothetical protein